MTPRYNPAVHHLCQVPGCQNIEKLRHVRPYDISKRICERCYRKAQMLALGRHDTFFLLNKAERAQVSAQEMAEEDIGDPRECNGCGETNCGDRCVHSY